MDNSSSLDHGSFKVLRSVVVDLVSIVQPEAKLHQACSPRKLRDILLSFVSALTCCRVD